MKTLNDIRKALKTLGFKVRTVTFSWGRQAIYCDADGVEMPSIFTNNSLAKWKPLIDWGRENQEMLTLLGKNEGIHCLASKLK